MSISITTMVDMDHNLPDDTISRFDVTFFDDHINTLLTYSPSAVGSWISDIEFVHRRRLSHLIVGLDIEWRPNFSKIPNPVATLQLCVGRRCLIFQLIHAPNIPSSLKNFLSNHSYTFVGIGIKADLEKLEDDYELSVGNGVDLRELAAEKLNKRELKNAGLKNLALEVLGKEIQKPKRVTMSRWDNPWLTTDQIQYACVDAYVCFEIGISLLFQKARDRERMSTCITTMVDVDHNLPDDAISRFDVTFFDDHIYTLLTHSPSVVDSWISDIEFVHRSRLSHLIVGLDIEWRPSFSKISNPVATLQLCVGRRCLIFQLIHAPNMPSSLKNFLSNHSYTFVGVGIKADLEKLEDDYELSVGNGVDLRELAAEKLNKRELKNAGLKKLALEVLGKEIQKPKRVTMSRWDNPWLTTDQIQYACVDAYVCFEIGRILLPPSHSST